MNSPNVGQHMARYPYIADRHMPVEKALEFMKTCNIRHLPVVEAERVVGLVSERDLLHGAQHNTGVLVEDVMSRNPYTVKEGTPLGEVAAVMAENRYGSAVVVSKKGYVIGIFTTTDGMRVLSELFNEARDLETHLQGVENFTFYSDQQAV